MHVICKQKLSVLEIRGEMLGGKLMNCSFHHQGCVAR